MSLELKTCTLSKADVLYDRALMLSAARTFFATNNITEVDTPILSRAASVDANIDLLSTPFCGNDMRYLHSSPEYGMKRLLAEGMGDIYQMSHVFRDGEHGKRHNPEFMLAEWYRCGYSFEAMIQETTRFISLFIGDHPVIITTYREALKRYAAIDYVTATDNDLMLCLEDNEIVTYDSILNDGRDALLNMIMATLVEPRLGIDGITVISHYPASQAALARKIIIDGAPVAERFEIYHKGYELANGYHELCDANEQCIRLHEENEERVRAGKELLPLDTLFLRALSSGIPDCCGVAVGIDRLMMLRHGADDIRHVIPFSWDDA